MGINYPGRQKGAGLHVVCITEESSVFTTVREIVQTHAPSTRVERTSAAGTRGSNADWVVIDAAPDGHPATDVLRDLRAGGFGGGVILLTSEEKPYLGTQGIQLGASQVIRISALVQELVSAIFDAPETKPSSVAVELSRTRSMIAAGEVAMRVRHALSNSLQALYAELQVLAMDDLKPEHASAVQRMLEQCRRSVASLQRLDFPESK